MDQLCYGSLILSLLLFTGLVQNGFLLLILYLAQVSLLNIHPSTIRSYGWEWQVAEATFLGIFVAPWYSLTATGPPSLVSIWMLRWLSFRLMWGAGMSKLGAKASACWGWPLLSCTTTHYETQPLPSMAAYFLHRLPFRVHQAEVLVNHLTELILPYGYMLPLSLPSGICGLISIGYMFAITMSGSYATINWIAITGLVSTMDDSFLCKFLPTSIVRWRDHIALTTPSYSPEWFSAEGLQLIITIGVAIWMAYLSIDSIKESLSAAPWLNIYNEYFLGNSYGVFGFVNSKRYVVVMAVKTDDGEWEELHFKMLPCGMRRRAPYSAPYHYRLDWQIWIETTASLERANKTRFVPTLMVDIANRIMAGDYLVASLFDNGIEVLQNRRSLPAAVRFDLYLYEYSTMQRLRADRVWWERTGVEQPLYQTADNQPLSEQDRLGDLAYLKSQSRYTWLSFVIFIGFVITRVLLHLGS